tara:strand:- start:531 stop:983 length:453 start_codon:yes stop_codon:yes gene_type:complete
LADRTQLGPSINLPPQILPRPIPLPRPILDAPQADLPSYKPILVPAGNLRGPVGTEEEEEDNEANTPSEVQRVTIPFTDRQIPIPQEEIMVTAATTAAISVAATLTATSLFKQCVKVFKPMIMQLVKRIQKKFTKNDTNTTSGTEEERLG